jgi:hypothetical protein
MFMIPPIKQKQKNIPCLSTSSNTDITEYGTPLLFSLCCGIKSHVAIQITYIHRQITKSCR